jgi:hypothetical protein
MLVTPVNFKQLVFSHCTVNTGRVTFVAPVCNELLIIHQAVLITSVLIRTQGYRLTSRDKNVNEEEQ